MINKDLFLVKAKRIDNGEWVEGYLYVYSRIEKYIIYRYEKMIDIEAVSHEIDPTTICRFTGLYKNNQKVWENDIIKYSSKKNIKNFNPIYAQIKNGLYKNDFDTVATQHCGFYADWSNSYNRKDLGYWINKCSNIDIVGNIFDNPGILEKQQKNQS